MKLIVQTVDGPEEYEYEFEPLAAESADVQIESLKDGVVLELNDTAEEAADRVKHTFELGSLDGVPEVKTESERQCVGRSWWRTCANVPVLYTRTGKVTLVAEIIVPTNINERIAGALRGCALGAIGAAGLIAVIGSPAASIPAFKVALIGCLSTAAGDLADQLISEVSVGLHTKQTSGPWGRSS
jgi:hypothetical protein